jgi:Ca2+-binding EF-hand superfamily protein
MVVSTREEQRMSMSVTGVAGSWSPQAMSGASMRAPPAQKMANLFAKIDVSGAGSITKSQFTQAFQTMKPTAGFRAMGADAVFANLDPSRSGSVSKQAFVSGMTTLMAQFRSSGA